MFWNGRTAIEGWTGTAGGLRLSGRGGIDAAVPEGTFDPAA
jgi:hypothetical protein